MVIWYYFVFIYFFSLFFFRFSMNCLIVVDFKQVPLRHGATRRRRLPSIKNRRNQINQAKQCNHYGNRNFDYHTPENVIRWFVFLIVCVHFVVLFCFAWFQAIPMSSARAATPSVAVYEELKGSKVSTNNSEHIQAIANSMEKNKETQFYFNMLDCVCLFPLFF